MGLIWVILFPFGAIIIRFLGPFVSRAVGKHRFVQIGGLTLLLVSGGMGVYLAEGDQFTLFRKGSHHNHADLDHYFGVAIIGAAIVQAVFGWYHHRRFVQDKPNGRRWFTHVHLWLGRILILCGMANCGFGFPISNVELRWAIIWWICCGIIAVSYFLAYVILALRQGRETVKSAHPSNETLVAPVPGTEISRQANTDLYRYYPGSTSPPIYAQNISDQNKPYWVADSEPNSHPSSVHQNFSSSHY
jgi:hypothetical protein